jgi:hypothetical protein
MQAVEIAILFAATFVALIVAIALIVAATMRSLMACYFPVDLAINKKNQSQFARL